MDLNRRCDDGHATTLLHSTEAACVVNVSERRIPECHGRIATRIIVKFKYDPDEGVMMLARPLPLGLTYPYDWGFVPSTRAADGDPLDAVILWNGTSYPG